jgi:signal recognition particle receptor subunit beta
VADSNDVDRLDDSRDYEHSLMEEIRRVAREEEVAGIPFLIFANKQDLPRSIPVLSYSILSILFHSIHSFSALF